jgi:cysteine desulfurase
LDIFNSRFYKEPQMIYLDHNATTPVHPKVLDRMWPFFSEHFGNAASHTHSMGTRSKDAVESARESLAQALNAHPQEIIFTSGATEALNAALKGIFWKYATKGRHFVTVATEHKAVLDTLQWLEKQGASLTILPVDENGNIDLTLLSGAIRKDTIAVVVMLANNETGVIHPIKDIASIVHAHRSILVCDATQAFGKMSVDVQELGADVLVLSAHKCYGPKGVGAMYIRRKDPRVVIEPLLHGGGHERGIRSGTLNVPGMVGLGVVEQMSEEWIDIYRHQVRLLRDKLEEHLMITGKVSVNGLSAKRLTNTISLRLHQLKAETGYM